MIGMFGRGPAPDKVIWRGHYPQQAYSLNVYVSDPVITDSGRFLGLFGFEKHAKYNFRIVLEQVGNLFDRSNLGDYVSEFSKVKGKWDLSEGLEDYAKKSALQILGERLAFAGTPKNHAIYQWPLYVRVWKDSRQDSEIWKDAA